MKQIFNIYIGSSLLIAIGIFFISYQLRQRPIYKLMEAILSAPTAPTDSPPYTENYLAVLKKEYSACFNLDSTTLISNTDIFLVLLKQVLQASSVAVQEYPRTSFCADATLQSRFHVRAKKDFYITITLKKKGTKYFFDRIENLSLLLYYHPEYVSVFQEPNNPK